jgi:GT2 family glycosyltransferase
MDAPDLSIVVVSFNVKELLRDCLTSIDAARGDLSIELFVVDNASDDGSADMVAREFPTAHLIRNADNRGFSTANNQALRLARGRYSLLLNPDTWLPPNALAESVRFMEENPDIGAMGPRLLMGDGRLDLACRRSFPSPEVAFYRLSGLAKLFPNNPRFAAYNLRDHDETEPLDVDSVCGAFMLVRREAIDQVGLLDEAFGMYGEDLDWAYRLKQAGWRVRYQPTITVKHYKGQSSRRRPWRALWWFYDAMHIFYRKHYEPNRPRLMNAVVHAAINALFVAALARNILRPAARRRVGAGSPAPAAEP